MSGRPLELVVASGKGGTGKTSVAASLAALAAPVVLADCDVDASDLHLLVGAQVRERGELRASALAVVDPEACRGCGRCVELCRFDAIRLPPGGPPPVVDELDCEGCGVCARVCPAGAIRMEERVTGEWFLSETRHGPMAHARLLPGGGSSGKLVAKVRELARREAAERDLRLLITDAPPGVGCPAISTFTGADAVLFVAEPTLSSLYELERAMGLAAHFGLPFAVCVNKWDVNEELSARAEEMAREAGGVSVGRVGYDLAFVEAQMRGCSVVEYTEGSTPGRVAAEVRSVWERLMGWLQEERVGAERVGR